MRKGSAVWLSHELSVETPSYGGGDGFVFEPLTRVVAGDTANTAKYSFPNHLGTHIDAPLHFVSGAPSLTDYRPGFWIFDNPRIVDVPGAAGYLVGPDDLVGKVRKDTDILLLRTGYEKFRAEERYWKENPGVHPTLGGWLRAEFPAVRVVGIDVISVTSRLHRPEGREAHLGLLDPSRPGRPVLAIEDMALAGVREPLNRVWVAPLMVRGSDGGPCSVLGFLSNACEPK